MSWSSVPSWKMAPVTCLVRAACAEAFLGALVAPPEAVTRVAAAVTTSAELSTSPAAFMILAGRGGEASTGLVAFCTTSIMNKRAVKTVGISHLILALSPALLLTALLTCRLQIDQSMT